MIDLNLLFHRHPAAIALFSFGVFLALSYLIALHPALELNALDAALGHASPVPPPDQVARGRAIYLREGCAYCHTQQVRPVFVDVGYGRPSRASDYVSESPPLAGTQRTGPDLSDVGRRQASVLWNLYHLFNPRTVVPQSVMPAFPWYFDIIDAAAAHGQPHVLVLREPFLPPGKVAVPRQEALDLVVYLRSLVQRRP
jgi:cytochrome c oxidase cbb3-type subunit II